jgi:vancomycin resistance protein YoaR
MKRGEAVRAALLILGALSTLAAGYLYYVQPPRRVTVVIAQQPVRIDPRHRDRVLAQLDYYANRMAEKQLVLVTAQGRWRFTAGELGLELLTADLADAVLLELRARRWAPGPIGAPLPVRVDAARLNAALRGVSQAVEVESQDALLLLDGGKPTVLPHVAGRRIDREALADSLVAWAQAGGLQEALPLPVREELPARTTDSMQRLGIRRLIAEWTTEYDPTIPRAENVERAAAVFDGLMLKPDQIVSYAAVVGPINPEAGWKEAFVIVSGELVRGVGGGVCQVATTFYGAVLLAGFEILERHPHQLAVPYVAPGLDAAVAPGLEDLKVRNTTPGHVLVRAEAAGGRVSIRLYGDLPSGLEVKVESRVAGRTPFETVQIFDPSLPRGARIVKSWGVDGVAAETFRLFFQNGQLVRRELLSRDSYQPVKQVVLLGR